MNEPIQARNDQIERAAYAQVDAALRTAPLAATPRSLYPAVMGRLRQLRQVAPPFQLSWLDYALLTFVAVGVALGCWFYYAYLLSVSAEASFDWIRYANRLNTTAIFATSFGLALIGLVVVFTLTLTHRQRRLA